MFPISPTQLAGDVVQILTAAFLAAWNAVAAEPNLQLVLASGVGVTLLGRWLTGRRRLRFR